MTAALVFAPGRSSVPVKILLDRSDTVVIARVVSASVRERSCTITINVQQVLKGAVETGTTLVADYRVSQDALHSPDAANTRGLFFLQSKDGHWSVVSATSGYISDLRDAFFVLPANSTPPPSDPRWKLSLHEHVLAELAAAMSARGPVSGGGSVDFLWEYRQNPSPAMKALIVQFTNSASPPLRDAALRLSVLDGEKGLARMEQTLLSLNDNDAAGVTEEIKYHWLDVNPNSVVRMGRIITSPKSSAMLRDAGLTALARVHTKESLPYLAAFLDNPDVGLRSLAVGGLAMFANNVPTGGHEPALGPWRYRTGETMRNSAMNPTLIRNNPSIVSFWKAWWRDHANELK